MSEWNVQGCGITVGQLLDRYTSYISCNIHFVKDNIHPIRMDKGLDYTREASSRYQQVFHPVILSVSLHLLLVAAGAGPGPIQEVERSSGCDQCQALEDNPDRAEELRPKDFHTTGHWVQTIVRERSRRSCSGRR